MGTPVGFLVGPPVGKSVGIAVGTAEGFAVGTVVGIADGTAVGVAEGSAVGASDGRDVGPAVGSPDGAPDGGSVGLRVVGVADGFPVWWLQAPGVVSRYRAASSSDVTNPAAQRSDSRSQPQSANVRSAPGQSTEHSIAPQMSETGKAGPSHASAVWISLQHVVGQSICTASWRHADAMLAHSRWDNVSSAHSTDEKVRPSNAT